MDNQHRKIKGYRELSEADIALMNRVKETGGVLEALIADLRAHVHRSYDALDEVRLPSDRNAELQRLTKANPLGWIMAAEGEMQTALMKLRRSVAQPTFF
ncbi:Acb2/Tad1 domain-containing protein [Burkholderia vietnamiensis]|uniref:Acb2/Tad1 domain-containing protein n=1 Tax=Burkholderia vietnamiensis TaxID=60552 RepID=UPI001CF3F799|nr:hypothetical protein [Burkholderia vietnamiensis]MCA7945581.1 hypothetical protein [Burkholderia vietnamiensis]